MSGNVENLRTAFGAANTEVAVIAHGKGLAMLVTANNTHADRMKALADGGVGFVACENTMKKKNVPKDQLLPFVTTVDSGVAEVVRKQEQGWSYIKSGI
jgi:intracellular sulfur oxidation DsrE/DsrF family protein